MRVRRGAEEGTLPAVMSRQETASSDGNDDTQTVMSATSKDRVVAAESFGAVSDPALAANHTPAARAPTARTRVQ